MYWNHDNNIKSSQEGFLPSPNMHEHALHSY